MTSENRRRVLEGAQYLVRYLIISKEDFKAAPYKSGLLTSEEAEAILANLEIGATEIMTAVDLPDHLLYWHSIWKKPRKGRLNSKTSSKPTKRGSLSSLRRGSVTPTFKDPTSVRQDSIVPNMMTRGEYKESQQSQSHIEHRGSKYHNHKEKFNFIEEFFICLACIFD